MEKKKPFLILIASIAFICNAFSQYENRMEAATSSLDLVNTYFDDGKVTNQINNFEFNSDAGVHFSISLEKEVVLGQENSFIITITPDNWHLHGSEPNTYFVESFKGYLVSTRDYVEANHTADYEVLVNGENKKLEDISESSRKWMLVAGSVLPSLFKFIPGIGSAMSAAETIGSSVEILLVEEPQYIQIWKDQNQYDTYPVVKPIAVKPSAFYRKLTFRIPFTKKMEQGKLMFVVDQLSIKRTQSSGNYGPTYFSRKAFPLFENGQGLQSQFVVLENSKKQNSVFREDFVPAVHLDMQTELVKKNNANSLDIVLQPVTETYTDSRIENLEIAIMGKKGELLVNGMPSFTKSNDMPLPILTNKRDKSIDALTNWFFLFGGHIFKDGKIVKESKALTAIHETAVAATALQDNMASFSGTYSEFLASQWAQEREFDFFQMPLVRNVSMKSPFPNGIEPINISIPLQISSSNTELFLYVKGRIHSKASLSGGIKEEFAYRIPFQYHPKDEDTSQTGEKTTIGLILDSSGSMADSDPNNIRVGASKRIVREILNDENMLIVDFDGSGRLINPHCTNTSQKQDLISCLNSIDSNGGTNIGAGLNTMVQSLNSISYDGEKTAVMLLTDGQGAYAGEIEWFKQNRIPVYTISYKDNADADLMEFLASESDGIYYQSNSEEEVLMAFREFYDDLSGFSKVVSKYYEGSGVIKVDQFFVEKGTEELSITLSGDGFEQNFYLISPTGRKHSVNDISTKIVRERDYINIKILNPEPGYWSAEVPTIQSSSLPISEWDMEVNYLSGPSPDYYPTYEMDELMQQPTARFNFEVSTKSPIKIKLDVNKDVNGNISLDFSDEGQVIDYANSKASVFVESEDGTVTKSAGAYSNGKIRFIPTKGQGNYQVDVHMDAIDKTGNKYERQFTRSVLVDEFTPGYMGVIQRIQGGYIYTNQGYSTRNRAGISVEVFCQESGGTELVAKGYVTYVTDSGCTIELSSTTRNTQIGDIVILNFVQWSGD